MGPVGHSVEMPEDRGEPEVWKDSWEAEMELGVIGL